MRLNRAGECLPLAAQSFLSLQQFLLVGAKRDLLMGNIILQGKNLLMCLHEFLPMAEKGVHHEREGEDKGENCAGDRLVALRHGTLQQIGLVSLHGT